MLLGNANSAAVSSRCCQNGLVSVWTVPQDVSDYPESSSSDSDEWWESEAKPKLVTSSTSWTCPDPDWAPAHASLAGSQSSQSSQSSPDGAVCVFQLKGHVTPVRALAFSPDGLALVSGGVGGLINVWSLRVRHACTAAPPGGRVNAHSSGCCGTGRLGAADRGGRLRSHPEPGVDPRGGRGRLLQQVKGERC